jgi:hypothetical protein
LLGVRSVTARCGEDAVRRDPLSPHRKDVAVRVALENTSTRSLSGRLGLVLSPGALPVECDPVSIPAGRAQEVECWLPLEQAPGDVHVELAITTSPAARLSQAAWSLELSCVEAPPANHVVVKVKQQAGCPEKSAQNGRWRGRVVARAPRLELAYCGYAWLGNGAPDLRSFQGEDWEVDEPVVVPLGGVPLADVGRVTDERLGIVEARKALARLPAAATGVQLAVFDTAALALDDTSADDNSDHGRVVGLVARRAACGGDEPQSDCPVHVDNPLSLPIVALEPRYAEDTRRGGFLGTRAQLAAALHDRLDAWEADGQREPLVINLSLGWHGKHDCSTLGCGAPLHQDLPSQVALPLGAELFRAGAAQTARVAGAPILVPSERLASEAVLLELTRARCLGALVFAAAGNAVGNDRQGPLLPGGWNALSFTPLPPASAVAAAAVPRIVPECRGLVDTQRLDGKPNGYGAPVGALLEAVGATAFDGQMLATTRSGSVPRLNAYGAGITVSDGRPRALAETDNPGWLTPASGTSLSTAIVSGAAARLWAQAGRGVAAHRIADQLHLDARRIPVLDLAGVERAAELYASADVPKAREVTACTVPIAFGVACGVERQDAGISLPDTASRGAADALPEVCLVEPAAQTSPGLCPVASDPMHEPSESVSDCTPGPGCLAEPAAVDLYEAPWVMPQPWGISCATCSEFHEYFGSFTSYAIDLDEAAPAFSGATSSASAARRPSIIGAAVRAGGQRTALALSEIKEQLGDGRELLRGRLYLDLWILPSPASLIVKFGKTSASVTAEVETALLGVEAP